MAECAAATSLAPMLEPVAGTALAVNVAYLALVRFRYRSKIRDHAKQKIESFRGEDGQIAANICDNLWFQRVARLGSLYDNDEDIPEPKKRQKMPDGFWGKFYSSVFEFHRDVKAVSALGCFCAFVLAAGTATTVNQWLWMNCLFSTDWIWISFYLTLLSGLVPVMCALSGKRVVKWAAGYTNECVGGIGQLLKTEVQQAKLPVLPVEKAKGPR
ncbi:hypothetical protein NKI54_28910 [Mesorhizobium sp. M0663]|uniref:hypothetical protein n=1 Tax=unclassified Mesorhizobium TaxID=325217 RepID=UPI00333A388D